MIKDVKQYLNIVGNRLGKAFSLEEFGIEEELEFWSLAAEHMSRKNIPAFTDLVQWIDLLYAAPVHFVYKLDEEKKLILHRRHIISENILPDNGDNKMPHEQSPQQKEFIQKFEHQVQNIEKKMECSEDFKEHGVSSHSIGQCEHIPLYQKTGEVWGVYFIGPYTKCPEIIAPKLTIVSRLVSNWMIRLESEESNPTREYDDRIKNVVSDLGTGKLNTNKLANLSLRYVVNSLNAGSGIIGEIRDGKVTVITSVNYDEETGEELNEKSGSKYFVSDGDKVTLSAEGEGLLNPDGLKQYFWNFKGSEATGFIMVFHSGKDPVHDIEPILPDIRNSVGRLLDYRDENIRFSDKYLDTYYEMLRAVEKTREKTRYHTPRMVAFVERFGLFFGLENDEMKIIRKTARLHDIGYVGTLGLDSKKTVGGELSHPIVGAEIIKLLPVEDAVVEGIRTHHEWVNGEGSPSRLKGDQIPWTGKIIAVFEYVVDFIESHAGDTSKTPEEWTKTLCKGIMERADINFDMVLVPTVIQLIQTMGWEACSALGVEE